MRGFVREQLQPQPRIQLLLVCKQNFSCQGYVEEPGLVDDRQCCGRRSQREYSSKGHG